jgi:hypothetical protein
MILKVPDLNPAAKNIPLGFPEMQKQGSFGG